VVKHDSDALGSPERVRQDLIEAWAVLAVTFDVEISGDDEVPTADPRADTSREGLNLGSGN
jgi:hypothetical protein